MKRILNLIMIVAVTVLLLSCHDGDPGPVGPAGDDGVTGDTGATGKVGPKGDAGQDAADGKGFASTLEYGNVVVTISGTRPDNAEPFTKDLDFKYSGNDLWASKLIIPNPDRYKIDIARSLGSIDDAFGSWMEIYLDISINAGLISINSASFYMNGAVIFPDNRALVISASPIQFATGNFSDFSYNETTGALTLNFSFTLPTGYVGNLTGYDMDFNGKVNVIVRQQH